MIDMTFTFLIFYLVTTTFERPEGILASEMPRSAGAPGVALPISPIVVRVERTGAGHDDYALRIDHFDAVPANVTELAGVLRQIQGQPGFDAQTPVVIVAKDNVPWDHVVGCWNAAVAAGYERVAFAEP
jgi:biopolymer transport protein ExbD